MTVLHARRRKAKPGSIQFLPIFLFLILLSLAGEALMAQGCAMCKTALQGQSDSVINALKAGIIVMLLPAITIVTAIVMALRQSREAGKPPPPQRSSPPSEVSLG